MGISTLHELLPVGVIEPEKSVQYNRNEMVERGSYNTNKNTWFRQSQISDWRSNSNRCSEVYSRGVRTAENQPLLVSEVEGNRLEIVPYQIAWKRLAASANVFVESCHLSYCESRRLYGSW